MHTSAEQLPSHYRVLRSREARDRIGLSRATIWRMVRNGAFPKPVAPARTVLAGLNVK